ncbi:MAG: DUF3879 family protein [Lachnospiraceae bacterium]|nr:DUF3879 family protein [Lachnospiraceae bacterium]
MWRYKQENDQKKDWAYRQAFLNAAKKADPGWEIGSPVPAGALDRITRESVEGAGRSLNVKI